MKSVLGAIAATALLALGMHYGAGVLLLLALMFGAAAIALLLIASRRP